MERKRDSGAERRAHRVGRGASLQGAGPLIRYTSDLGDKVLFLFAGRGPINVELTAHLEKDGVVTTVGLCCAEIGFAKIGGRFYKEHLTSMDNQNALHHAGQNRGRETFCEIGC